MTVNASFDADRGFVGKAYGTRLVDVIGEASLLHGHSLVHFHSIGMRHHQGLVTKQVLQGRHQGATIELLRQEGTNGGTNQLLLSFGRKLHDRSEEQLGVDHLSFHG